MSARTDEPSGRATDVLAQLAEIVLLVTGNPVEDVQPERHFVDDLRIDSLSMVEILEGAAQHFGVRIEDEAAKDFVRVRDLVDYLEARRP
jgi:acyl carrier protein